MPSDDPITKAVEGATNALINRGVSFIKGLAKKFLDRKIAFVQDEETLDTIREDLRSNESKFYRSYIDNKDLLTLTVMGLTLRRLEEKKEMDRIENLRFRLLNRYGPEGIHVAQAVQSGIVSRYITYLMEIYASNKIMREKLLLFLENIETHTCFVSQYSEVEKEVQRILIKLNALSPEVFVISGMGSMMERAGEIITKIDEKKLPEYQREDYLKANRRITFFHRMFRN